MGLFTSSGHGARKEPLLSHHLGPDHQTARLDTRGSGSIKIAGPMRRRLPEALLALATIALVLLALAGIEWGLRHLRPTYLFSLRGDESSNVFSETYGWELRPGFRGRDLGELATINRRGYRGPEHPYARPAGRTRVVMLGDSIAYGAGVQDGQTFSALLESRGERFDVVNLAVGGYGTDQELIRLEREGLRYAPDVVVLHFCLFSDFADNGLPSALFDARQPKPYFTWDGRALQLHDRHLHLGLLAGSAQWLSDWSHAYNRLVGLLGVRRAPREPGVWADRMASVLQDLPAASELTFRLIRRMADRAAAAGARFVVVVHPDRFAFQHRSKLLRKFCGTALLDGIPVIEMGERYRAEGLDWDAVALDEPGHLTHLGHQKAADALARALSPPLPPSWDYRMTCRADELR